MYLVYVGDYFSKLVFIFLNNWVKTTKNKEKNLEVYGKLIFDKNNFYFYYLLEEEQQCRT